MRARRIIGLVLIVVGIVLIAIGAYLITYHYKQYLITEPSIPPLGNYREVYPYTFAGFILVALGLVTLIVGVLLLVLGYRRRT